MRAIVFTFGMTAVVGCSAREDEPPRTAEPPRAVERIDVPRGTGAAMTAPAVKGRLDLSLAADEGSLEVVAPPRTTVGTSTTARIRVIPAQSFHINTEYPFELSLVGAEGLKLDKLRLAGGRKGKRGDAEVLAEGELLIPITLTPTWAGRHTLTGTIGFGICQKDRCLQREMPVSVTVEAS